MWIRWLLACNGAGVGHTGTLTTVETAETGCEAVLEDCNGVDDDCDGAVDEGLIGTPFCTAPSCALLLAHNPDLADGTYPLDPEHDGLAERYTCDMSDGGWTRLISFSGEQGLEALESEWPVQVSNSTVEEASDHIRWYDGDQTGDVHVLERIIEVPNDGGVRLTLDFSLRGPDNSAFWLWLTDEAGTVHGLACQDGTRKGAEVWEDWEWALRPYACDVIDDATVELELDTELALEVPAQALGLTTLIKDRGGDQAQLYSAELWVK